MTNITINTSIEITDNLSTVRAVNPQVAGNNFDTIRSAAGSRSDGNIIPPIMTEGRKMHCPYIVAMDDFLENIPIKLPMLTVVNTNKSNIAKNRIGFCGL